MDDQKVNFKFVNYPGAVHSFTNPEATEIGRKFKMPVASSRFRRFKIPYEF
jgi:dienelactone hydrolase